MNFSQTQTQIQDLPATFKRQGIPYTQLIDAITAQLYRMTMAADGQEAQGNFSEAQFGWLDAWGLLFNVGRGNNQPDSSYKPQIQYTVTARGGPPLSIAFWIFFIFGIQVQIIENFPNVGYQLIFPATLTPQQIAIVIASINYVRPAGVPFVVEASSIGTYLTTVNFLAAPKITGAYLAGGTTTQALGIGASTNNSAPVLPDYFLTDPTLNPTPPGPA